MPYLEQLENIFQIFLQQRPHHLNTRYMRKHTSRNEEFFTIVIKLVVMIFTWTSSFILQLFPNIPQTAARQVITLPSHITMFTFCFTVFE